MTKYEPADIARSTTEMGSLRGVMIVKDLGGVAERAIAALQQPTDSEMLSIFWETHHK